MSLLTTWTTAHVPTRRTSCPPEQRSPHEGPRPAWDCVNCALLNPGSRKRCTDCGTTRD